MKISRVYNFPTRRYQRLPRLLGTCPVILVRCWSTEGKRSPSTSSEDESKRGLTKRQPYHSLPNAKRIKNPRFNDPLIERSSSVVMDSLVLATVKNHLP